MSVGLISIAMLFLATQILLKKNGKFPITSVGKNPEMRKRGLSCAKCDEQSRCHKIKELKDLE
ncbi:MAG: hypothetical protein HOB05_12945 [Bacteroidetes bacterium]|nr:hypothetical protein [Bacteroidota bacterium]